MVQVERLYVVERIRRTACDVGAVLVRLEHHAAVGERQLELLDLLVVRVQHLVQTALQYHRGRHHVPPSVHVVHATAVVLGGLGAAAGHALVLQHDVHAADAVAVVHQLVELLPVLVLGRQEGQEILVLRHEHGVVLLLLGVEHLQGMGFLGDLTGRLGVLVLLARVVVAMALPAVMLQTGRVGAQLEAELHHRVRYRLRRHIRVLHAHHVEHGRTGAYMLGRDVPEHRVHAVDAVVDQALAAVAHQPAVLLAGQVLAVGTCLGVLADVAHRLVIARIGLLEDLLHVLAHDGVGLLHLLAVRGRTPQAPVLGQARQQELRQSVGGHRLMRELLDEAAGVALVVGDVGRQHADRVHLVEAHVHAAAQHALLALVELSALRAVGHQLADPLVNHAQMAMHVHGIDLDDAAPLQVVELAAEVSHAVHDGEAQLHLVDVAAEVAAVAQLKTRVDDAHAAQVLRIERQHRLEHSLALVELPLDVLRHPSDFPVRHRHVPDVIASRGAECHAAKPLRGVHAVSDATDGVVGLRRLAAGHVARDVRVLVLQAHRRQLLGRAHARHVAQDVIAGRAAAASALAPRLDAVFVDDDDVLLQSHRAPPPFP